MKQSMKIEEVLEQQGIYVSTTVGTSMYPLLRSRCDTIVIRPVTGRLNKYDVPLYRRGSDYVLHRIVKVTKTGYVICGDNCLHREYGITDAQIVGVLSGIVRGEKGIDLQGWKYRWYCRIWVGIYPLRYAAKRVKMIAGRIKNRGKRWNSK